MLKFWWNMIFALGVMHAADPAGGGAGDPPAPPPASAGDPPAPPPASAGDPPAPPPASAGDPPAPVWPENWRENYAKGDEKLLNRLKRFNSPNDVIDSFMAAEKKLSSGNARTAPPENAKPEEMALWRKENGIPEEAAGYNDYLSLPDNLQLGDDDKTIIADFFNEAHAGNMRPDDVNRAVNWYFTFREQEAERELTRIASLKIDAENELHREWGDLYKRNVSAAVSVLEMGEPGLKELVFGGTLADGTPIGNHPGFLRLMSKLALEINPAATVVPGAGTNSLRAIDDEISSIEKRMHEDRDGYFKDEKMQNRYRELLSAKEKIGSR